MQPRAPPTAVQLVVLGTHRHEVRTGGATAPGLAGNSSVCPVHFYPVETGGTGR